MSEGVAYEPPTPDFSPRLIKIGRQSNDRRGGHRTPPSMQKDESEGPTVLTRFFCMPSLCMQSEQVMRVKVTLYSKSEGYSLLAESMSLFTRRVNVTLYSQSQGHSLLAESRSLFTRRVKE